MARPRKKDRSAIGAELCQRVASGELVKEVCEDLGIALNSPFKWAKDDPAGFGTLYARAREDQAHSLAEQAMEIAAGNDAMTVAWERGIEAAADELSRSENKNWKQVVNALESNLIQRNRLRVDTLKWFTSKIAPRTYGDKVQAEVSGPGGGPIAMTVHFVGAGK